MRRFRVLAAGVALALLTILAVPASAQYLGVPETTVPGGVGGDSGTRPTVPVSVGGAQASSGRLALTGADVIQLVVIAGGCLMVGVVLTRSSRRKRLTA